MTFPPGGLHSLKPPERLPMPHSCARSREIQTGGQRPWFICGVHASGIYCGRRVTKLYGAGKLFACRRCYCLAYQSQRERAYDRALTRTQNIRMKLGGSPSLAEPFPDKPKGMWWRTYWRLRGEAQEAEYRSWIGVAERFGIVI